MATNEFDNSWIYDIQDKIYSRVDAICAAKLKSKYPDINVTTDSHKVVNAKFPNVFIHFMSVEIGKDLENRTINAIYLTAEVSVTVTFAQKMEVANEVSQVVSDCMKDMQFDVNRLPEFNDTDAEYRTVSRFSRTVGQADILYTV